MQSRLSIREICLEECRHQCIVHRFYQIVAALIGMVNPAFHISNNCVRGMWVSRAIFQMPQVVVATVQFQSKIVFRDVGIGGVPLRGEIRKTRGLCVRIQQGRQGVFAIGSGVGV